MTWEEFKQHTMPLAVQLGAEWDIPTWRLYHRGVQNVPMALYAVAIQKAAEGRTKMPSASQMRVYAEEARRELLAAHCFKACEDCAGTGWATVVLDGVSRVERCLCWKRHQRALAELGVTNTPLALPEAREMVRVGNYDE